MKRNLLRLVMLFVTTVLTNSAFAQSSMLATLNHEGTISAYYGVSALKDAYEAATDGDVITLASGTYLCTNLTKAVSICGAGMGLGAAKNIEPTIISGDFDINIPTETTERFTIEGIYHNGKITYYNCQNVMFLKSRFGTIVDIGRDAYLGNATFVHCRIASKIALSDNSDPSLINCIVNNAENHGTTDNMFEFTNCIMRGTPYKIRRSTLRNCIFYDDRGSNTYDDAPSSVFASTNSIYNTIGIYYNYLIFENIPNSTNTYIYQGDVNSFFKTYGGKDIANLDSEDFELTDDAKVKYLGMDGTQVGIYGGNLPFDPIPSNPQITKCNVAAKSTADGKLSVDIEVKASE